MSLYHKYRPDKLTNMVGNANIIKAVTSLMSKPRQEIPTSFLFKGMSGSGKTTSPEL